MWHPLQIATRILAGVAGALSFYGALFLYEDEQGKIQNKLEEWWVNLTDQRTKSLSRHTVLMRAVAASATRSFNFLFGERIVSFRAFAVSACFSVASLCLFIVLTCAVGINPRWNSGFPREVAAVGAVFAVFGTLQAFIRKSVVLIAAWYVLFAILFGYIALLSFVSLLLVTGLQDVTSPELEALSLPILIPVSFLCDVVFLLVTRWALRWCSGMDRAFKIVMVMLIDIALAAVLSVLPLRAGAYTLAELNSGDTLVCLVFVLLFFLMVAHRLMWPVINRPLYALATRTGVRRSLLIAVGMACLVYAGVPGTWLKKIFETFAG
jgi:hypothetical protein